MSKSADPLKILLVDGHALFREGMRKILEAESDLIVVGQAADWKPAVAQVRGLRPDVVLLDVQIPADDPAEILHHLLTASPGTRVIGLSIHDDGQIVWDLLCNGASGYLLKSATREELLSGIRSVGADGGRVILSISRESLPKLDAGYPYALSPREEDVLALVAQAMSNAQIATRLGIAEGTVKRHLRNVFTKLGAVSRIDAVNKAVAASLITVKPPRESPPLPLHRRGVRRSHARSPSAVRAAVWPHRPGRLLPGGPTRGDGR